MGRQLGLGLWFHRKDPWVIVVISIPSLVDYIY
jgi:hypothetical protein